MIYLKKKTQPVTIKPLLSCLFVFFLLHQVFSEDLIRPLFSREWSLRENAFHHFRSAMRSKMQPIEGAPYADEAVLKACCGVLAMGCADPVYKIYVAALVSRAAAPRRFPPSATSKICALREQICLGFIVSCS